MTRLSRLAPAAATALAEALFLRPHRKRLPQRERAWLQGAERLWFEVAGRRLAGWSLGEGPTVLLVHGWGGRGSQLGAFAAPLVARGFRVVSFDGPGHGASPGRRSSVPEMAEAVAAVGRQVGPLHGLIAHSLGAAASTIALHAGLSARRCVYVAPPSDLPYFTTLFCDLLGFTPDIAPRLRQRIERRFDVRFDALNGTRLAAKMATPPLLIFHDRGDADVPFTQGRALAAAWRDARLVATIGLGHRVILRRDWVVDRGVRFLVEEDREASEAVSA